LIFTQSLKRNKNKDYLRLGRFLSIIIRLLVSDTSDAY
jgi:hypothetical protein